MRGGRFYFATHLSCYNISNISLGRIVNNSHQHRKWYVHEPLHSALVNTVNHSQGIRPLPDSLMTTTTTTTTTTTMTTTTTTACLYLDNVGLTLRFTLKDDPVFNTC